VSAHPGIRISERRDRASKYTHQNYRGGAGCLKDSSERVAAAARRDRASPTLAGSGPSAVRRVRRRPVSSRRNRPIPSQLKTGVRALPFAPPSARAGWRFCPEEQRPAPLRNSGPGPRLRHQQLAPGPGRPVPRTRPRPERPPGRHRRHRSSCRRRSCVRLHARRRERAPSDLPGPWRPRN
jgi:hypothetical protein